MTRTLRYLLIAAALMVSMLLFLLATVSDNTRLFETHYSWIVGANVLVGSALFLLVLFLLARLISRYRRNRFGSRLMTRLVLMFTLIGVLPGLVIYLVSVQFVSRSIESWFNVKVETALESGLTLGRSALDSSLKDLRQKARVVAAELSEMSDSMLAAQLARTIERNQLNDAIVVTGAGQLIASTSSTLSNLVPDMPTTSMISRARTMGGYGLIEGGPEGIVASSDKASSSSTGVIKSGLRLRVLVAIQGNGSLLSLNSQPRYLQIIQAVPEQLSTNAEALQIAYGEYQERSLARAGLRNFYLITLTLTLLLAVFAAMVSAFLLATDLAQPLLLLAEGTKAVAEGDLSPRPIAASSDELGTLTKSFNMMTSQLADAREAVERNRKALEEAKAYLESVLANMSAGVMVLDDQLRVVTFNASAEIILHQDLRPFLGLPFAAIDSLSAFSEPIILAFSGQSAHSAMTDSDSLTQHWQRQIEIPRQLIGQTADSETTLLARGARLPVGVGLGHVVVFDDISDLISGQRSIAWAEVARRLAHEIKNPLTPIQLSAERLMMKLQNKLSGDDAALLERGTNTIVNQVVAMQKMVDNFRDYAKTPPPDLKPLDLNNLISEILELYAGLRSNDQLVTHLDQNLPNIMGDATQLRQVLHNLLQNAQDATAELNGQRMAHIEVSTEAIHYNDADGATQTAVSLSISDNGPGFDSKVMARAFEPYVTSKPRGTGLGLPVVKKIIEEHGGRIELQNRKDGAGARVSLLLLRLASI
ncbi:MAG: ATP-binding protein [Oxalobacteraceae bacterium]|nr:ATP-binding protein [Oxalobacteraceae bacterium]